jgi:hypothetical protein
MNLWENRTVNFSIAIIGGTAGAAGWIYGAAENLAQAGCRGEAQLALFCDGGVILTGGILWLLWLAGCRLSVPLITDILLGASFVFGVLAIWIMHLHGVLVLALDPSGKYPEWLAWLAPIVLLVIIAITRYPPAHKWMLGTRASPKDHEQNDKADDAY